jgi:TusA-related sulfurtransferase
VPEMSKLSRIDLNDVPWPVNLLKCHRHADEMQSGDEIIISLRDKEVKENLVLLLNTMPELRFHVSTAGKDFVINVKK